MTWEEEIPVPILHAVPSVHRDVPGEGEAVEAAKLVPFEDFEQVLPLLLIIHANLVLEEIQNPLFELFLAVRPPAALELGEVRHGHGLVDLAEMI